MIPPASISDIAKLKALTHFRLKFVNFNQRGLKWIFSN